MKFRLLTIALFCLGLLYFQQSQAQFNGCQTGFCSKASAASATCASVLPGLVVNLDASVSASVHLSGSNVTQWDDQSSNGNNFPQATGARQPTYSATGFNTTKPGIRVVAANAQFLQNTAVPFNSANMSVFVVQSNTGSTANNGGLVSFVGTGQANDFGNNASFNLTGSPNTGVYRMTANTFDDQQPIDAGTAATIGWVFDGSNGTGYLNFVADTPAAKTGAFGNTTANIALGTRPWNGNTPSFDGTYAELILTNSVISGTPLTTLHTCLSTKWGVS